MLVRGGTPKKPGTLEADRGRIEGHIIPLLGRLSAAAVTKPDVERFMHAVAAGETQREAKTKPRGVSRVRRGRGVATRTVGLLGAIFRTRWTITCARQPGSPGMEIRREQARAAAVRRRICGVWGTAAAGRGTIWPQALACARFLALTGWRTGEALTLRWRDIDLARRTATLPDTKTGRSMRGLSRAARDVLCGLGRGADEALVFPATRGDGPMVGFKKMLRRLVATAGLPEDVTAHVLRHSFASLAADLGYSEPTIAALVGHKGRTITSRYVHAPDAVLLAAADAVARRTLELMGEPQLTEVVPLLAAG